MSLGTGLLELRFSSSPSGGRSELVERKQRFPLRFTTTLYPDVHDPGLAYVYVQNPTGGVFPGDKLRVQVAAERGVAVCVTTTSATKLYAGEGADARMELLFRIHEGSYLEHLPDLLIPHAGARYIERLRVELSPGGVFIGVQSLAPGRRARGETFAYGLVDLRTDVSSVTGEELCVDRLRIQPGRFHPTRQGFLGTHAYLGSVLVVAPDCDAEAIADALDEALPDVGAATPLPFGAGALARVTTSTAIELRRALCSARLVARKNFRGRATGPVRK